MLVSGHRAEGELRRVRAAWKTLTLTATKQPQKEVFAPLAFSPSSLASCRYGGHWNTVACRVTCSLTLLSEPQFPSGQPPGTNAVQLRYLYNISSRGPCVSTHLGTHGPQFGITLDHHTIRTGVRLSVKLCRFEVLSVERSTVPAESSHIRLDSAFQITWIR
jgi:hypothetical protein